jgi:hypothetical protein
MKEPSHSISTRLFESELTALNLKLKKDGYSSTGELVRQYLADSLKVTNDIVDRIAVRVAEIVSLKLASATKMYITRPDHEGNRLISLGSSSSLV